MMSQRNQRDKVSRLKKKLNEARIAQTKVMEISAYQQAIIDDLMLSLQAAQAEYLMTDQCVTEAVKVFNDVSSQYQQAVTELARRIDRKPVEPLATEELVAA